MIRVIVVVLMLGILMITAVALAQPNNFAISWWTVDGGGGNISGGEYALNGTFGQSDGHIASTGGNFRIHGGFWQPGVTSREHNLYLPVVINQ